MKVLELFAGYRSIGKSFEEKGHEVYSVEWDRSFDNISLYTDIGTLTYDQIIKLCNGKPNVIWASFDCTTYSIAGGSHHRTKNLFTGECEPKSDYAKFCDNVNKHVLDLIDLIKPDFYFIENPVGMLRKMLFMQKLPRYTITYCQYGDFRMKPTDIWTNYPKPNFKPRCKNGMSCHVSAPRGSSTGTQGIKGKKDRSRIPKQFCEYIVEICERGINND